MTSEPRNLVAHAKCVQPCIKKICDDLISRLKDSKNRPMDEFEFSSLNHSLTSVTDAISSEELFILVDAILEGGMTASSERLKLVSSILPCIEKLSCMEKEILIQKIYRHLSASARGIMCAVDTGYNHGIASCPQIVIVFNILASVLQIQCSSRVNDLHDIHVYIRAVVDFLQSRVARLSSEYLESALRFLLALCKCSGGSFSWLSQFTLGSPDGLPFSLFLITIEVELKLGLPTHLEGYLEIKSTDANMTQICLELLSLLIAEIAESDLESENTPDNSIMAFISDEMLSSMLKRLIGLGELMATSLTLEYNSALTDTTSNSTSSKIAHPNPLILDVLAVYLQWSLHVYKNRLLAVGDTSECVAAFDETFFQPTFSSTSKAYDELAKSFQTNVWAPLQPLLRSIIPEVFRLTNLDETPKSVTLCRKHILRLARLFPAVVASSFDTGFMLSLLVNHHADDAVIFKSPIGISYLRDICNLLEISQMGCGINESKEGDASINVIGRLTSILGLAVAGSAILDGFKTEVDGQLCDKCKVSAQTRLAEAFCDVMVILRILIVNVWLVEFALRLRPSRLFDPVVPAVPGEEEAYVSKWISEAALTVLRRLAKLEPSSLLDWNFFHYQDHAIRGFYTSCTLRSSAEAVLHCCRNICSYSSVFRAAWQRKYTEMASEIASLYEDSVTVSFE